jgi:phosphorylase/glycogen(starch) synthase
VWARRFAEYKRPFLLLSDLKRLERIVSHPEKPIQFVISGKAHPSDPMGQEIIRKVVEITKLPQFLGKIVYVPDYAVQISRHLTQGADIWLNTPIRGKEACGTSGLKASLNGALQCSISDGWVDEVDWKGMGWILAEENTAEYLYNLLENDIPNLFYDRDEASVPNKLVDQMKKTIEVVDSRYSTARMLKDYLDKMY